MLLTYMRPTRSMMVIGAISVALSCSGQNNVLVYGAILDMETQRIVEHAAIDVVGINDSVHVMSHPVGDGGRYSINLAYGAWCWVKFRGPGYVTKIVELDLRGVPLSHQEGGHGMEIDVPLVQRLDGVDHSLVEHEPYGIARYDVRNGNFNWDMDHSYRMRELQRRILEEHARRRQDSAGPGR